MTVSSIENVVLELGVAPLSDTVTVTAQSPMAGAFAHYAAPLVTERYAYREDARFQRVEAEPVSTFSVDVDSASYANVRRFLNNGTLPPDGAVRIEELINYFRFDYPPAPSNRPFSVVTELSVCAWNAKHQLMLVGLRSRTEPREPAGRNLVFLIDVSGSMDMPDKLPLVRQSLRMLTDTLTARDRIAIVVYAGDSRLLLPSTPGDRRETIHRAIMDLRDGGSTNGSAGIRLADSRRCPDATADVTSRIGRRGARLER